MESKHTGLLRKRPTQEDMIPKPLLGSLDTLTIKGYFFVDKIVNLLVKGSWEKSKYGYALVVNEFKEIIPSTKDGIIAYLSATVNGIKESMAKKIVGQFGLQTLEVFENSPEQLLTVKGIGRQRLQKIIGSYKDSRSIQEIVSYPPYTLISLHNHPTNNPPTGNDLTSNGAHRYLLGVVVTHNGKVFTYKVGNKPFTAISFGMRVDKYRGSKYNLSEYDAFIRALNDYSEQYGIEWREIT